MLVTVKETGERVHVVSVTGRIDSFTHTEFEEALHQILKGRGIKVVLDFSGVDMIGSQGIGSLAQAAHICENLGGQMVICGCNLLIEQALTVSNMQKLIPICGDVGAAKSKLLNESRSVVQRAADLKSM